MYVKRYKRYRKGKGEKDMMQNSFHTLIKITQNQALGWLPDPFLFDDGRYVKTREDWEKRRQEIYRTAVELPYGKQPPNPEFLEIEPLNLSERTHTYRLITGPRHHPVSFSMTVKFPAKKGIYPAVIDGDLCWDYAFDKEFIQTFTHNNILLVLFNRTELAADVAESGRNSPLYQVYPDYSFGALGAWAWGYSRCVDALEKLGFADMSCIAFTGHSRGGKAALLAGALDQRAAIVNPNDSGAGGCGCYRVHMKAINEAGQEERNEQLDDLVRQFAYWFSPELADYSGREEDLPFDQHYLKAMVSPRVLLETNAASDIWANPIGSWQTAMAAKEVYRLLGAEDHYYWHYRRGYHFHKIEDIQLLVNIILHYKNGTPLLDGYFQTPFPEPERIFDWRCPKGTK